MAKLIIFDGGKTGFA